MDMDRIRQFIIGLVLVSLIAASAAIALDAFQSDTTSDSYAWNISGNGLRGIDNTTSYFDTAGTIAGVALLLTIVIGAFYFVTRR
jgi:hypothetical protein